MNLLPGIGLRQCMTRSVVWKWRGVMEVVSAEPSVYQPGTQALFHATAWDILYATERKCPSRQEQWSRNMNRRIKCSVADCEWYRHESVFGGCGRVCSLKTYWWAVSPSRASADSPRETNCKCRNQGKGAGNYPKPYPKLLKFWLVRV